jgi:DtxR family transcriptional regulator, Mn-dependent transcriptional regulator
MASHTEENYLKTIYLLSGSDTNVNASELSRHLNVSLPTVNSMMRNLEKQGLVNYKRYKPMSLTDAGRKLAAMVLRKHRLTEMFLYEKMGFGWEEVHEIAEQMEHINSNALFEKMDELLGFPANDPHGSPIPDKEGKIIHHNYKRLSDCFPGDTVTLSALANSSTDFLKFLDKQSLNLGTKIEILTVEAFDKSMTVSFKDHLARTFSKEICDRLFVTKL